MRSQGRKNIHGKTGVRFKARYNKEREYAMLRNIVTEFIIHEKIILTPGILKKFIRTIDRLITYAKKNKFSLANRVLRNEKDEKGKKAITKLFKEIAPRFKDKNGGYTRRVRCQPRRGDGVEQIALFFS